jgi:hypothetical protein
MDPPPQAYTGVGHDPEYTMTVQAGQFGVTVWTEGAQDVPAVASAVVRGPPSAASAASYRSAGRTPLNAVTRCPSGRISSTVCAAAPG